MTVINSDSLVLGRMSSMVAERLLKGEAITLVNVEKSVITGRKENILARYKKRYDISIKGNPHKGPNVSRMPDRIVSWAIRGMLPIKRQRGREAYKRLNVVISIPEEFKGAEFDKLRAAQKREGEKVITIAQLSKDLGAKW